MKGHDYADPLVGVEGNVAYNAFLVGKSLIGIRVTDVLAAVTSFREKAKPSFLLLRKRHRWIVNREVDRAAGQIVQ